MSKRQGSSDQHTGGGREILTRLHLDGVVTVVDAVHGLAPLDRIENRAQVAYADRMLLQRVQRGAFGLLLPLGLQTSSERRLKT